MTYWARLSVGWYRDPKVAQLDADAELLYVRAIAYTVDELTDGFVSRQALPIIGSKLENAASSAAQLCAAKLWVKRRNGWTFPPDTWAKWQETRDKVAARRADAVDRQRRSRTARVTRDSHVTDSSVTRDSHVSHSEVTLQTRPDQGDPNLSLSNPPKVKQTRARQTDNPVLLSQHLRDAQQRENNEHTNGRQD